MTDFVLNENIEQKPALAVWPAQVFFMAQAAELATTLAVPLLAVDKNKPLGSQFDFLLCVDASGLSLLQGNSRVQVNFVEGANAHRRLFGGGRGQSVAKAVGLKSGNIIPHVLDATAGLGRDAFVLASLGCQVDLCERVPLVHLLLQDGLLRAQQTHDASVCDIANRMVLQAQDALTYMQALRDDALPDVIYLDPMFPERRKKAAVKKDMAAFHQLVGADLDSDALLLTALTKARCRVVVKRSSSAPHLAGRKPSTILQGESTRFDIYALRSMAVQSVL